MTPASVDESAPRPVTRVLSRVARASATPLGVVLVILGVLFVVTPTIGLLVRLPWTQLPALATEPVVRDSLRLSLLSSVASLGLATIVGVPLAWALARGNFRGRRLLRALCILPMVMPPVVGGVGLLATFGRRGFVGAPLDNLTGVTIPYTLAAVVLAATFVSVPFLILTVEAGFRGIDRRLEDAAATLGASRWMVFRRVTLPLLRPALLAGMAIQWARALGEFGATITFAGNLPGRTQTVPMAVVMELERDPGAAIAMSSLLLGITIVVLLLLRNRYLNAGVSAGAADGSRQAGADREH